MDLRDHSQGNCPQCGWPESQVYEVVSRHATSTGVVVYARCVCGRLRLRFLPRAGRHARLLARATRAAPEVALGPIVDSGARCGSW